MRKWYVAGDSIMQKRSAWQIQKAVWYALLVRELKTRFGGYRLGYFWALFEPLSHIIVLSFLFSQIRDRGYYDVPFPVFFATGILTYFVFQKIVTMSQSSITVNRGLFIYRQVKPFDAIVVRALIEFGIIVFSFAFLMWFGGWFFGYQWLPADPLRMLLVLVLVFTLSLGFGLVTAMLGAMHEEWAKFIPILMRPLYFISGIFFPLQALPSQFHKYLLWNPLLHAVEELRASYLYSYPTTATSLLYLLACALPALYFGMLYYFNNRTRVLMT